MPCWSSTSRAIRSASLAAVSVPAYRKICASPAPDGDTVADLAADVFFHLAQGRGLLRLSSWRLAAHGDGDAPVIAVCHGTTLTHPSPASPAQSRQL